jgi:hypothetical protein
MFTDVTKLRSLDNALYSTRYTDILNLCSSAYSPRTLLGVSLGVWPAPTCHMTLYHQANAEHSSKDCAHISVTHYPVFLAVLHISIGPHTAHSCCLLSHPDDQISKTFRVGADFRL